MAHVNKLQDARVLIFGSTSGIGFAVASLVLSQGAYVTISGSGQPRIDSTIQRLRSFYPDLAADRINGFPCDLTDKANLETNLIALFDAATDNGANKINHVVFTAGNAIELPPLSEYTVQYLETVMAGMRIVGAFMIAKLLTSGKYMEQSAESSFTFTGGVLSDKPMKGWVAVTASGASKEGMARGLALELAPIRVNVVSPGIIQTELLMNNLHIMQSGMLDHMKQANLLTALGQPGDTAEAYAYIMKDRFITGSVIETNGGHLLK